MVNIPYIGLQVAVRVQLAKGHNTLHQFSRSKSAASPQQVGNFPVYGEVSGKRV